ncbi:MAG TPA: TonB-dependent receptor [Thermoanaerobaculia bacterium]|nr:TonB-dependent receptor [Thermoanaerobaculia bacterium]
MRVLVALFAAFSALAAYAQSSDYIEVTATKIEETVLQVPGSVTVISREDLDRTGARDLRSALALAGGVSIAPGGDGGPAGSIPEIWGLREADAFLLIVDGVPSGGAFMPQTEAIDIDDVERIEIVRGSAPVVYGATAFSGVIHIIHRRDAQRDAEVHAGSYGSAGISANASGLTADIDRERFRADRTGFDRGRFGWHGQKQTGSGLWRFDADALRLQQDPASPHPREGASLSSRFAIDTNVNPLDAHIDETRFHGSASYDRPLFGGTWTTTLALTHSSIDTLRGFIEDLDARSGTGFDQSRRILDAYLDSHLVRAPSAAFRILAGIDYLGGNATAESSTFDYSFERLDVVDPVESGIDLHDRRNFLSAYAQSEWTPAPAWRIDTGLRLNHTRERKGASSETNTRPSGLAGVSRMLANDTWLFADYRNTFKPAVVDFGPDDEDAILRPETSASYEIGIKRQNRRLFWQATAFTMNMNNLVVAQEVGGQPSLANGGKQRFRGAEVEANVKLSPRLRVNGSYSHHDARFRDYVQDFDGVPTQLRGRRFEMSPRDLATAGATFGDGRITASLMAGYTGWRFLNKRNTALAGGFTTVEAGFGMRTKWADLRIDGRNLTNRRDPIAESELGDAQYYLMPARSFRVSLRRSF